MKKTSKKQIISFLVCYQSHLFYKSRFEDTNNQGKTITSQSEPNCKMRKEIIISCFYKNPSDKKNITKHLITRAYRRMWKEQT